MWLHWRRLISLLLFFVVFAQSAVGDIRFHHFYLSGESGLPVYQTGELSETSLQKVQEEVPAFQWKREQLNPEERLLIVQHPALDVRGFSFKRGLRFIPSGFLPDFMTCALSGPEDIFFQENPVTPYELHILPGSINTRCSQLLQPETGETIPFARAAADEFPSFPDGLWLLEVPPQKKERQKAGGVSGIPGGGKTGASGKLLSGSYRDFGPIFDFRPGGGGPSNLMEISVILAHVPAGGESNEDKAPEQEERVVIDIVDARGRQWQQAFSKDQAKKLLEGVGDGEELLSRLRRLEQFVDASEVEVVDLSFMCRESLQRVGRFLGAENTVTEGSVPGVINYGKEKDKHKGGATESTRSASGNSGSSENAGGKSVSQSATGSGVGAGPGSGNGGGDRDDEEPEPKRLKAQCEAAGGPGQGYKQEVVSTYLFKDEKDQTHQLTVLTAESTIENACYCAICFHLCNNPRTICPNQHIFCAECLSQNLNKSQNKNCPSCRLSCGEVRQLPFINRLIGALKVHCPNKDSGCDKTPEISDLKKHYDKCPYKEINCPNEGCGEPCLRIDLEQHQDKCLYQKVPCQDCDSEFRRLDLEAHRQVCQYRQEECTICNEPTIVAGMGEHLVACLENFQPQNNDCKKLAVVAISLLKESQGLSEKLQRQSEELEVCKAKTARMESDHQKSDQLCKAMAEKLEKLTRQEAPVPGILRDVSLPSPTLSSTIRFPRCILYQVPGKLYVYKAYKTAAYGTNVNDVPSELSCFVFPPDKLDEVFRSDAVSDHVLYTYIARYHTCLNIVKRGESLGAFVRLEAGDFDNEQVWPFNKMISIGFLSDIGTYIIQKRFAFPRVGGFTCRPGPEGNPGYGLISFMSMTNVFRHLVNHGCFIFCVAFE